MVVLISCTITALLAGAIGYIFGVASVADPDDADQDEVHP